jgi:hypothetical protein
MESEVIEDGLVSFKACAYITQRAASCNLAEKQMQQLVIACQVLNMHVSMILHNEFVELVSGYEIHDLREYIATDIHNYAVCRL